MIPVSDEWKSVQQRFLLTESYIEIDVGVTDDEAQNMAIVQATDEALFSNAPSIMSNSSREKYASNELNLWALDGTRAILPSEGAFTPAGYVSDIDSVGSVTLSFPTIRTSAISGLTITWGNQYGEYPKAFTVMGRNGDTILAEVTVTDNRNSISAVSIPLENYNSISIVVHEWGLPNRRVRIEKIAIGHLMTFTKSDLLSFTHEQDGDLLSGKIPKYSIEFSLDNSDGRWDPNNPTGMAQYLSERQKLTLRYGLDVNGTIEWIPGGVFYLSEWIAPPNGIEARFVARDVFEFLLNEEMWSSAFQPLSRWIEYATDNELPSGATVTIAPSLASLSAEYAPSYTESSVSTNAEIVQKCANAGCCILRYDRAGVLHVERFDNTLTDYRIPLSLSYTYPEMMLSKPLKEVAVDYGADVPYTMSVDSSGVQQTLSNDFIRTENNALTVAGWVRDILKTRKTVSGEFRADPRLDVYDVVVVEDRYGNALRVAITNIKYTFNGAFRGTFTGRILEVAS